MFNWNTVKEFHLAGYMRISVQFQELLATSKLQSLSRLLSCFIIFNVPGAADVTRFMGEIHI